jgi:site-specific recombinase XerD
VPRRKTKVEYVPGSQPDQLHGAFDLLLLDRQAGGCSAYTLRFYRQQLLPFIDWLLAHSVDDPRNITVALIQQFTVERFAKAKPSTRRAANVAIRSYLRFCADPERGIIDRVPTPSNPSSPHASGRRAFPGWGK